MASYRSIMPGDVKKRGFPIVDRNTGEPIIVGTVRYYLRDLDGANAGKWWRASDNTWQTTPQPHLMGYVGAGAGWMYPPDPDVALPASPFVAGTSYYEYADESLGKSVPVDRWLLADPSPVLGSDNKVLISSEDTEVAAEVAPIGTTTSNIVNMIGSALTGAGNETLVGLLKAAMSKTAAVPTIVGGTYDPAIHSLQALRERGDAAWVSVGGGGAYNVPIRIVDQNATPVDLAKVYIYNPARTLLLGGPQYTNNDGLTTFSLDADTYSVVVRSTPHTMTLAPQVLVVTGNLSSPVQYALTTTIGAIPPADPDLCRLYGWVVTPTGAVAAKVQISFRLVAQGAIQASSRLLGIKPNTTVMTDDDGYFEIDLIRTNIMSSTDPDDVALKWRVICTSAHLDTLLALTTATQELTAAISSP